MNSSLKDKKDIEKNNNGKKCKFFQKPAKNLFWAWIAYQTIKGTLTLSFIWIPLIYMWFSK